MTVGLRSPQAGWARRTVDVCWLCRVLFAGRGATPWAPGVVPEHSPLVSLFSSLMLLVW